MASVTIKSAKTIQDVAKTYTGSIANALSLTQSNKLKSQNLVVGQKIIIPDSMLTAEYRQKLAEIKAASAMGSMKTKLMLGVAAVGAALWYAKTKGKLSFK